MQARLLASDLGGPFISLVPGVYADLAIETRLGLTCSGMRKLFFREAAAYSLRSNPDIILVGGDVRSYPRKAEIVKLIAQAGPELRA